MKDRTPHADRGDTVEQVELERFLGVELNGIEPAVKAPDRTDTETAGCGCGGSCSKSGSSAGGGACGGDGSCCGSGAAERGLFDGLHGETVLSRRAFFWTMSRMLATAGAVALTGGSVMKAMAQAGTDAASGAAARLPRADAWVMVIDMAACTGCKQCMRACKDGHYLPQDEHNWIEVWAEEGPQGRLYRPRPCMQCENAPCVPVCPVDATYHNRDGIVLVDNDRCIGCRACMAACPYGARYFWWDEPVNPLHLTRDDYSPETTMPHRQGTVSKCVFCADYLNQSRLPRCVQQCPHNVLWFGEKTTDVVTNGVEVRRLSALLSERGYTRYKEEKGTEPRVYYLASERREDGHASR